MAICERDGCETPVKRTGRVDVSKHPKQAPASSLPASDDA